MSSWPSCKERDAAGQGRTRTSLPGWCMHVSEDMQPSVPDGWRCAVLNLSSAFQVGRSRRPRRPKRVAQAGMRYRCRRRGPCRPPRRRAASGVPEQVRRAPIIEGAKVGQLPASSCAHALTPLTGRCAAPKAHAWAQHARSRLAHAHLTAARSRQWRSLHRRPAPFIAAHCHLAVAAAAARRGAALMPRTEPHCTTRRATNCAGC